MVRTIKSGAAQNQNTFRRNHNPFFFRLRLTPATPPLKA